MILYYFDASAWVKGYYQEVGTAWVRDLFAKNQQIACSAYTFPREARIHQVRFDDEYMHVELVDGRMLSVPLLWIPTLYNAPPEEREKYELNRSRTMIIWDPDKCAINDELSIADYLGPYNDGY